MDGEAELGCVGGYIARWFSCPKAVTRNVYSNFVDLHQCVTTNTVKRQLTVYIYKAIHTNHIDLLSSSASGPIVCFFVYVLKNRCKHLRVRSRYDEN